MYVFGKTLCDFTMNVILSNYILPWSNKLIVVDILRVFNVKDTLLSALPWVTADCIASDSSSPCS